jgi:CHAD domain-containing protein
LLAAPLPSHSLFCTIQFAEIVAKPWTIPDLNPDESLAGCVPTIVQTRLDETLSYEEGSLKGTDVEAIHDMRVASRRLQTVLQIFKECLPRKRLKKVDKELRLLIRRLGSTREHDVFLLSLQAFRSSLDEASARAIDLLIARETGERASVHKQLVRSLKAFHRSDFRGAVEKLLRKTA